MKLKNNLEEQNPELKEVLIDKWALQEEHKIENLMKSEETDNQIWLDTMEEDKEKQQEMLQEEFKKLLEDIWKVNLKKDTITTVVQNHIHLHTNKMQEMLED